MDQRGLAIMLQGCTSDAGIESPTTTPGLGLLNLTTSFASKKEVRKRTIKFPQLQIPWEWLSNSEISGYEIHFGESISETLAPVNEGGLAYIEENIMATYIHGIFENDLVLNRFSPNSSSDLDGTLNLLSEEVIKHIDSAWIEQLIPMLKGRNKSEPTVSSP